MTGVMRRSRQFASAVAVAATMAVVAAAPAHADHLGSPPGANLTDPASGRFDCKPRPRGGSPIVLVHGFNTHGGDRGNWGYMSRELTDAGFCVFTLTYGEDPEIPLAHELGMGGWTAMERSAQQLRAFVDRVLADTGADEVDLLGHSAGTVMPRHYLERLHGAAKVKRFVALAPMWRGTGEYLLPLLERSEDHEVWGPIIPALSRVCAACQQMWSGSSYLAELNADGEAVPGVRHTNIVTRYDEMVHPYTSGIMRDGGTNIVLQDVCPQATARHSGLASDRAVRDLIVNALDPPRATAVRCPQVVPG